MDGDWMGVVLSALGLESVPSLADLHAKRLAAPQPTLDSICFMVYSSGTTGEPKGIVNPHRAPVRSYLWRFGLVDYGPGDIVACNVFFIWECVRPLLRGGAVVPVPPEVICDGYNLGKMIMEYGVTEILVTPSLFENILNMLSVEELNQFLKPSLKSVLLNGVSVTTFIISALFLLLSHIIFISSTSKLTLNGFVSLVLDCFFTGSCDFTAVQTFLGAVALRALPECVQYQRMPRSRVQVLG